MRAEDQQQLADWIWAQPNAVLPAGLRAVTGSMERGLLAYREHAKALAVRALASACPRLKEWLGPDEFAGLAWSFARACPPRVGDMNRWGGELPDFLRSLPGMEPEPPALAALDLGLHSLLTAADAPEPNLGLWSLLQTEPAEQLRASVVGQLLPLPATLQRLLQDAEPLDWPGAPGGQAWLWRRGWRPCWCWLPDELATLLHELQQATQLALAVERTMARHPQLDLGLALRLAWSQGWLQDVRRL